MKTITRKELLDVLAASAFTECSLNGIPCLAPQVCYGKFLLILFEDRCGFARLFKLPTKLKLDENNRIILPSKRSDPDILDIRCSLSVFELDTPTP